MHKGHTMSMLSSNINFHSIFADSYSELEKCLPALTGLDRTQWAQCRKQHFSDGLNAESLAVIEKALFHVSTFYTLF